MALLLRTYIPEYTFTSMNMNIHKDYKMMRCGSKLG